jgi:hypothetical protein
MHVNMCKQFRSLACVANPLTNLYVLCAAKRVNRAVSTRWADCCLKDEAVGKDSQARPRAETGRLRGFTR